MGRHNRVIVIGSGVSGLACARELVQRGYEVLVVEARSRVGGRLKGEALQLQPSLLPNRSDAESQPQPQQQQAVDLGGALIHGIDQNPIHTITTQMGVPLHEISDYCLLMDENGWPFDPKVDEKLSTLFNECLDLTFARTTVVDDGQTTTTTTTTKSNSTERNSKTITFGDVFDQVCREKSVNPNNPLLKWHQANLELPTGADFHDLGLTWNDDEPYGFAGAHAAPETSWKFVMDHLAEGLDILYNAPVTQIQVVGPDGTTPTTYPSPPPLPLPPTVSNNSATTNTTNDNNNNNNINSKSSNSATTTTTNDNNVNINSNASIGTIENIEETNEEEALSAPIKVITRTEWRNASKPKANTALSSSRQSRRIRGDDINVRRSARSTKGVIQMLNVGHDQGTLSYDDPSKKHNRKRTRQNGKTGPTGNKEDEEENDATPPASTVQITLQNGTVLEANAVICTLPLGILKVPPRQPGHVAFVPPLPSAKRSAIRQLGCGLLNKCAISFPDAFWQDSEFLGLAEQDHSYLVLNAMKYTGKPILIFMYGGGFAKEVESWTDGEVVEDCMGVLKKICGKEVPTPVDYCVTRWGKEQFSRMAFTFIPPGVDGPGQLAAAGEAIHDPALPEKPLIMFAGEHTTPYHPSTMHGAFLSGIREAYRYDIFVDPELNDNMEFDTDHKIFEHTFQTRRVYKGPKVAKRPKKVKDIASPVEAPAAPAESQIRSRRRRFANMALRKLPRKNMAGSNATKTITPTNTPSKKRNGIATPESLGSQRSRRSVAARKAPELLESPLEDQPNTDLVLEKKRLLNELEDRILVRSLESYGRDPSLVRSKAVPVFGSTRKRSVDQIRQRWQQIGGRKRLSEIWRPWQAEVVAPKVETSDSGFSTKDDRSSNTTVDTKNNGNQRRSKRDVRPAVVADV